MIRERYGLLTSAIDVLSVVPLVMWMSDPDKPYLAAPTLLAVPLVHAAKGQSEHAAVSLVARAGVMSVVYFAAEADRRDCAEDDFVCYPMRSFLAVSALVVPLIVIDAMSARSERIDDAWSRLPALGVTATAEGGRMLTLGGAF